MINPQHQQHQTFAALLHRWLARVDALLLDLPLRYHIAPLHAAASSLGVKPSVLRAHPLKHLLRLHTLLGDSPLCEPQRELRAQLDASLDRNARASLRRLRRTPLLPWRLSPRGASGFSLSPLHAPDQPSNALTLLEPSPDPWPDDAFLGWRLPLEHGHMAVVGLPLDADTQRALLDLDPDNPAWTHVALSAALDPLERSRIPIPDPLPSTTPSPHAPTIDAVTQHLDDDVVYSRWASPNHRTFQRARRARVLIALARDEEDMRPLLDAIRRLRYELLPAPLLEQHRIQTPSSPTLPLIAPDDLILSPLHVSPDASMPSASPSIISSMPLALLRLPPLSSLQGLGPLSPVGAALRRAHDAHDDAILSAARLLENEQRWLASFGHDTQRLGLCASPPPHDALMDALRDAFDPTLLASPLRALNLSENLLKRLHDALGPEANLGLLPNDDDGLRSIPGIGPRSASLITQQLMNLSARWRVSRAGLSMQHAFRDRQRGADDLRQGLDSLASLFRKQN